MKKHFLYLLLAMPLALTTTSCSDDDDPIDITVRLNQTNISYSEDDVWEGVATNNMFASQNLTFSHEGEIGPWGLVWNGFTPARVSTIEKQSDWLSHQFQIMTGGGISGSGTPYIVGFWNTQENESTPVESRSCRITYQSSLTATPQPFRPLSVYVQNTAYSYYTMTEGNAFSTAFKDNDYLDLTAHGVHADGSQTSTTLRIGNGDGRYANQWTLMDLSSLGEVTTIYFTMEGSDTGSWGLNTPSYFALDALTIRATLL